jgi:hypothetical protein
MLSYRVRALGAARVDVGGEQWGWAGSLVRLVPRMNFGYQPPILNRRELKLRLAGLRAKKRGSGN